MLSFQFRQVGADEEREETSSRGTTSLPSVRSRRRFVSQAIGRFAQQSQKSGVNNKVLTASKIIMPLSPISMRNIFSASIEGITHLGFDYAQGQCDQMVILFFHIWPFTKMVIMSQICQISLNTLANKK